MILIGSQALKFHAMGILPNDIDYVGTYEEAERYRKRLTKVKGFYPINGGKTQYIKLEHQIIEIELAWPDSRAEKFLAFAEEFPEEFERLRDEDGGTTLIPSLDVLYMLKMSHRYLKDSPHFLKTMRDIRMMRKLGAYIKPAWNEYFKQREKDTYTYNLPKLNVSKDAFFDQEATGVVYTYDHDSIHEAMKTYAKPAYQYFKPDESQVMCSEELFYKLALNTQMAAVIEESYVLAIERSLVPFPNGKTPKEAFDMALMKVCTSITSGWFRQFAWEQYNLAQAMYKDDYFDKFEAGLAAGIVKPFNGSTY